LDLYKAAGYPMILGDKILFFMQEFRMKFSPTPLLKHGIFKPLM
jgi:hypothetical protein